MCERTKSEGDTYLGFLVREKVQGKFELTLIFTVFNGSGGIFACKVKFTVFTVKNLF